MKELMAQIQVNKTLMRISHEIIERHIELDNLVLLGIKTKGVPIAHKLSEFIHNFSGTKIPAFEIDISQYRDDDKRTAEGERLSMEVFGKHVILVDDVLFTGRSVRAAMDAVMDLGRAKTIQLAVLVDRGHRELPIRADYVGKNVPTSKSEEIYFDITNQTVYLKEATDER